MADVIHLSGPVLVNAHESVPQAWVIDGTLTFSQPGPGHDVETVAGWVIPGLVDAHCHIGLGREGPVSEQVTLEQALTDRDNGTLLVRDCGSPTDTRWIQQRADLPKVIRAGRHIARTRRYLRNYAWEVEPEDLVATVRSQARAGDGWVKIVGDWIDRDTGDLTPCWPADVVAQAVAAAHDEGARTTFHCFGEEVLADLLAAGTDCVEHASGLTDDTIAGFAAAGIAIVPTAINIANFPQIAAPAQQKYPQYYQHMMALYERRRATIASAFEAGIPLFVGTDAGGSLSHGLVAAECQELVECGIPPTAVLAAATWAARDWLDQPGLVEGADADLLVLPSDPREELAVLAAPTAVMLRGVIWPGSRQAEPASDV